MTAVVMVLPSHTRPEPLSRLWCLWEAYSALDARGVELRIWLPRFQEGALRRRLLEDYAAAVHPLQRVQAEHARASSAADHDNLHSAIKSMRGGYARMNRQLTVHLQAWVHAQALLVAKQRAFAPAPCVEEHGDTSRRPARRGCATKVLVAPLDATAGPLHDPLIDPRCARDLGLALLLYNVGTSLDACGQHKEAVACLQEALSLYRATCGEQHTATATAYNGLALALANAGQRTQALPLHARALAIRRATLGEGHMDTAASYNNLATLYRDLGQLEWALKHYLRALEACRAALGESHGTTAHCLNGMAIVCRSLGRYTDAFDYASRALKIYTALSGETNDARLATSASIVASVHVARGEHETAARLFERALASYQACLGEEHPDTGAAYTSLAQTLAVLGAWERARQLLDAALASYRGALGEQHVQTARAYARLATLYEQRAQFGSAARCYSKAVASARAAKAEQSLVGKLCYGLAVVHQKQHETAEARRHFQHAHRAYALAFGPDHPDTVLAAQQALEESVA
jgi:tetratricopeptide (TPR) repeat protein